jgi:hypothetical protein
MIMRNSKLICALAITAITLSGCSTTPRNFAAQLSAPPADRSVFEVDFRACDILVRSRQGGGAGAIAAAGGAGIGTGALVLATKGSGKTFDGWEEWGKAVNSAAYESILVGGLVAFVVTRAILGARENKYKAAIGECLAGHGYSVDGWNKLKRLEDAAQVSADAAEVAPKQTAGIN